METPTQAPTTPEVVTPATSQEAPLKCPSCGEGAMRWQDLNWRTGRWRRWGVGLLVLGALLLLISGPAFLVSEAAENSPARPATTIADADATHAERDLPPGTVSGRSLDPNPRSENSPEKIRAFTGMAIGGLSVFAGAVLCIGRRRLVCPACGFKTRAAARQVGQANHRP